MRKNVRHLTHAALIAALYVALTYLQNFLVPGSATFFIQFRVSEALCVLALFTPAAIPGLSIGCLLFNLSYSAALPLDFLVGTLATTLACSSMYLTRKITFGSIPFLSLLMPAFWNALLVGWELAFHIGGGFWLNAAYVAIGEAAVLLILGTALYQVMVKRGIAARLFENR
ncbi:MAG: QueT transporter family protein [Oscillospiraceae bacterium]|nr:QueT transporter family protein [Oscillospiraceae bacterium]